MAKKSHTCERCALDVVVAVATYESGSVLRVCGECADELEKWGVKLESLGVPDEDTYRGVER